MSDNKNISDMLHDLEYEFDAEAVWSGHVYGFENMYEYYSQIVEYMSKHHMNPKDIEQAYTDVENEFKALVRDENRSFLNDSDTAKLYSLDRKFLKLLAHAAQEITDALKIDDLRFEPEMPDQAIVTKKSMNCNQTSGEKDEG